MLCISLDTFAQSTKVKGRVIDSGTGEGIPFAAVLFKDSQIGITADIDGYYFLETRDQSVDILCAQMLSYETQEIQVKKNSFNEINFRLKMIDNVLGAATVRPDNRKIKRLLAGIEKNRKHNDPEYIPEYQCDMYNKMEMDITNAEELLKSKNLKKQIGFISDYMDTSAISGIPYLPAMISETVSKKYHSSNPTKDREIVTASKISGIEDNTIVSEFTGSLSVKINVYDDFVNFLNISVPSPLSSSGLLYYNYFIVDSLQVDSRKTYVVRYHPKKLISSPAFDGEMRIDAEEFAVRSINARMNKLANVNWVRDFALDVEYQRLDNGRWFHSKDKIYADFSVTKSDSSKIFSFLGTRELFYSNIELQIKDKEKILNTSDQISFEKGAPFRSKRYWDNVRPYSLTPKEKGIYEMVDSIKTLPLYKTAYGFVNAAVTGYIDTKYIGFGSLYKLISFNNLEGVRLQLGLRTTKDFSKFIRLSGYGAYGTKRQKCNYGGTVEMIFNRDPFYKLTLDAKVDAVQLGMALNSAFAENNILSSLLSRSDSFKISPIIKASAVYDHEWSNNINTSIGFEHRSIFSNEYVPMITPQNEVMDMVALNQFDITARFSWKEQVTRGFFEKLYVNTRLPVVTLNIAGGVKGLTQNDYSFLKTEVQLDYKVRLAPFGQSKLRINAGPILGQVPYPLLKIPEGNATYFFQRAAFNCMDFYEFASDSWATLILEHNFSGYFLGKIPLLRRLDLREVMLFKMAYGRISPKNDGSRGFDSEAILMFRK